MWRKSKDPSRGEIEFSTRLNGSVTHARKIGPLDLMNTSSRAAERSCWDTTPEIRASHVITDSFQTQSWWLMDR